jgi:aconitate hydratase
VVTRYLKQSGLLPYLEALGFHIVGYGCTTCIGNSGPLPDPVAKAVDEHELVVAAVLSGNRNFEGRIHPQVRASFLASPPLVVAYALAGTVDTDLERDPIGFDPNGDPVFLRDIWPTSEEVDAAIEHSLDPAMFREEYGAVFRGDERWQGLPVPEGQLYDWDPSSTYVQEPPYFQDLSPEPTPPGDVRGRPGARPPRRLGDHRPHLPGRVDRQDEPRRPVLGRAGRQALRIQLVRLAPGQSRGDDPRHVRQHPPP